jgi:hypothetical protein
MFFVFHFQNLFFSNSHNDNADLVSTTALQWET